MIPRSFTFNVLVRETADGRIIKNSQGGPWLRLARKMVKNGQAKLVCNSSQFAGYGRSYDVGYQSVNYTVTEVI